MATIVLGKYTPAIVLFVVFLFVYLTVWAIRYFGHDAPYVRRFPPWLSPCPDYWTHFEGRCYRTKDAANGRAKCGSKQGEYNPETGPPPKGEKMSYASVDDPASASPDAGIDMNQFTWGEKCKWTKSCDVFWEGVSDQDCGDKKAFEDWDP